MHLTDLFRSPGSRGLLLCVLGFIVSLAFTILVPLYMPQLCSEHFCPIYLQSSLVGDIVWQFQQPSMNFFAILWLASPLLASVLLLIIAVLYVIQSWKVLLQWFFLIWAVGLLPFSMLYVYIMFIYPPFWGFFGIVIGYIFFFAGFNSFLSKKG